MCSRNARLRALGKLFEQWFCAYRSSHTRARVVSIVRDGTFSWQRSSRSLTKKHLHNLPTVRFLLFKLHLGVFYPNSERRAKKDLKLFILMWLWLLVTSSVSSNTDLLYSWVRFEKLTLTKFAKGRVKKDSVHILRMKNCHSTPIVNFHVYTWTPSDFLFSINWRRKTTHTSQSARYIT